MNLRFTEEQEMMRKMVRDFAQTEIAPFVEKMEQGEFPRRFSAKWASLALWEYRFLKNTADRNGLYFLHYRHP